MVARERVLNLMKIKRRPDCQIKVRAFFVLRYYQSIRNLNPEIILPHVNEDILKSPRTSL